MCSHYEPLRLRENYKRHFYVDAPDTNGKSDMRPRYRGNFIRKPPATDPDDEALSDREAPNGRWGLISWRLVLVPEKIKAGNGPVNL